jgi:hypothetical protein
MGKEGNIGTAKIYLEQLCPWWEQVMDTQVLWELSVESVGRGTQFVQNHKADHQRASRKCWAGAEGVVSTEFHVL